MYINIFTMNKGSKSWIAFWIVFAENLILIIWVIREIVCGLKIIDNSPYLQTRTFQLAFQFLCCHKCNKDSMSSLLAPLCYQKW